MAVDLITKIAATTGQSWLSISFKILMILKCFTYSLVQKVLKLHETEYHLRISYFVRFPLIW